MLIPSCITQTGGGPNDDSPTTSDSEETQSLREIERNLAEEEEIAKAKYYKIRRQLQSIRNVIAKKRERRSGRREPGNRSQQSDMEDAITGIDI